MTKICKKQRGKTSYKALCLIIMVLGILLLTPILVSASEIDNWKSFDKDVGNYGKITVYNWNIIGKIFNIKLSELELKTNTDVCGSSCSAETEIVMHQDGVLIDDVIFVGGKVKSYEFYVKVGEEQVDVDNYDWVVIKTYLNGTDMVEWEKIGTIKETRNIYEIYNLGDEVKAGTYYIKLEGEKKASVETDWQITSQGKLIDEWAVWGGIEGLQEYQTAIDNNALTTYGDNMMAQNWTVGTVGDNENYPVTKIGLQAWKQGTPGTCYISLTATTGGIPNFTVLTYGEFNGASLTPTSYPGEWVNTSMISNYTIVAGRTYGIWMNCTGDAGNYVAFENKQLDVYAGGMAHRTTGGAVLPWDDVRSTTDFAFEIYAESVSSTVILNTPTDGYSSLDSLNFFNCSANVVGANVENISLWIDASGTYELNQSVDLTNSRNSTNFSMNLPEGSYSWSCKSYDTDGDFGWASSNYTISVDTIAPIINFTYPVDTVNYGYADMNLTFNWSVSDVVGLSSCWYSYNNTNTTLTCLDLNETIVVDSGWSNITIYANDTVGNVGSSFVEWVYNLFKNSESYVSSTVEGSTNDFIINVTYLSTAFDIISGTLNYNTTEYPGTKTGEGNNAIFTSSVSAPNVNSEQNISFYWKIGLTDGSGTTYINISTNNQTVNVINMSICGYPHTIPFLNFTIYNEQSWNEINGTIELTFNYRQENSAVSNTFSYSDTTENNSRFNFCINPSDETYTIDSILEYDATNYAQRYYNFEGVEFTNTTTEIGLYLLNEGNSTSFLVEVQDENYQPKAGVEVYMQIYRVDTGQWITTEISTTNDDGETVNHIYTEDAIYRFKIYDNGDLLYTTTGSVISCPSTPCTVTITISEDIDLVLPDFEDLDSLETSLEYDSATEMITYTYSDTSGNFTSARFYVIRNSFGEPDITSTCDETSTSSTAVLTCDLTNKNNGTYIATGFITRISEKMVERKSIQKIRDIVGVIGLDGILWSFFLLIGILMLGVYRPSLGIIFGTIGVFLMSLLGLMQITITALVALIGVAIILLIEVRKQ